MTNLANLSSGEGSPKIGDILVSKKLISREQVDLALEMQELSGVRLGRVLIAQGLIKQHQIDEAMSTLFKLPFLELKITDINSDLIDVRDTEFYIKHCCLPFQKSGNVLKIAVADPMDFDLDEIKNHFSQMEVEFYISYKSTLISHIQILCRDYLNHKSIYALESARPKHSASRVFVPWQFWGFYLIALVCVGMMILSLKTFLLYLNISFTFFIIVNFLFKFYLTWVGSDYSNESVITKEEVEALKDHELPTYTVLVAVYKEPKTLPIIVNALRKMNYPKEKLDLKIVLEEDDPETLKVAQDLELEDIFDIIIVPKSFPKTKPKACNYALQFAKGELLAIYDAEDKPEDDQLKKAVACFKKSGPQTVCVQSRLNYYNPKDNWLSRMFTIEYSLWYDFLIPALSKLHVPIPLGGTSNHFKTSVLKNLEGWDAFNVTEDADLGIRFSQLGLNVQVINSTTFEEANNQYGNWIRQRSRWQKGYMQTYLVHMRHPLDTLRMIGAAGFFSLQFFIGGTFVATLILPFLYINIALGLFLAPHLINEFFPPIILSLCLLNMFLGNIFFIYSGMLGVLKRKNYDLIPYALLSPIYWILGSIAAYKGFWQLLNNPFYWEKTQHGLSKVSLHETQKALR